MSPKIRAAVVEVRQSRYKDENSSNLDDLLGDSTLAHDLLHRRGSSKDKYKRERKEKSEERKIRGKGNIHEGNREGSRKDQGFLKNEMSPLSSKIYSKQKR